MEDLYTKFPLVKGPETMLVVKGWVKWGSYVIEGIGFHITKGSYKSLHASKPANLDRDGEEELLAAVHAPRGDLECILEEEGRLIGHLICHKATITSYEVKLQRITFSIDLNNVEVKFPKMRKGEKLWPWKIKYDERGQSIWPPSFDKTGGP